MAKIIFLTGGAQSGKARWAIDYLGLLDDVMYMCIYGDLEEAVLNRIKFNNDKHGISWNIKENATELNELMKGHKFAILDNLGEYTNRAIKAKCDDLGTIAPELRKEIEKQVADEITELIWEVKEVDGTLLILSVELGFCPVPYEPAQKVYRKMMGNINQRVANQCSEVYLMVSGIASKIK